MIDTVVFENDYGERLIPHQFGVWMKSHDAPLPAPRLYQYAIDGMDGMLDMTEWAGETIFENRDVTIAFLDMSAQFHERMIQFCHGRMVKIMFSDDPEHYFYGRGSTANKSTRWRVTDGEMTFTCEPYRLCRIETVRTKLIQGATPVDIMLKAKRKSAVPMITTNNTCAVEFGGNTYELEVGDNTINDIIITDRPSVLTITPLVGAGDVGNVTVSIKWRDGVL